MLSLHRHDQFRRVRVQHLERHPEHQARIDILSFFEKSFLREPQKYRDHSRLQKSQSLIPGKSNAEAPRFFPLPEKKDKKDDDKTKETKGRKKKVKDMDPQFEEEEVGW